MKTKTFLVPGAWSGAWIWESTVSALRERGIDAETLTLPGLEDGVADADRAKVSLEDQVTRLVDRAFWLQTPVILVSHSYSSIVTAQVADRLPKAVAGVIHVGGLLPSHQRSMLDDWRGSLQDRDAERQAIATAGDLWLPPTREMLDAEADLTEADRDFLAARFTPHPGKTITDPAYLNNPIQSPPTTYIALSPNGPTAAWREAPTVARDAASWRHKDLRAGHWPMLSRPEETVELIDTEVTFYGARRNGSG